MLDGEQSGGIAAEGYRSKGLDNPILESALRGRLEGDTQRRVRRRRGEEVSQIGLFRNLRTPL